MENGKLLVEHVERKSFTKEEEIEASYKMLKQERDFIFTVLSDKDLFLSLKYAIDDYFFNLENGEFSGLVRVARNLISEHLVCIEDGTNSFVEELTNVIVEIDQKKEFLKFLWNSFKLTKTNNPHIVNLYNKIIETRNDFVCRNLRLVSIITSAFVKKHNKGSMQFNDIYQEGVIGLIGAVERYRPWLDIRFSTFSYWRILGAMTNVLRKKNVIRQPSNITERLKSISSAINSYNACYGKDPTNEELSVLIKLSKDEIDRARASKVGYIFSFDSTFTVEDSENHFSSSFVESFPEPKSIGCEDSTINRIDIKNSLSCIKNREKRIFLEYYNEGKNLGEIGEEVGGLSRERIRQLNVETKKRLKNFLEGNL